MRKLRHSPLIDKMLNTRVSQGCCCVDFIEHLGDSEQDSVNESVHGSLSLLPELIWCGQIKKAMHSSV